MKRQTSYSLTLTCDAATCANFRRCTLAREDLVGERPAADFYPDKMLIPVLDDRGAFGVVCGEFKEEGDEHGI